MQRGIERALLHTQDVARDLLDTFRNSPAVERLKRQGAEDEQVQRALRKINGSRWHQVPLLLLQEDIPAAVEAQGDGRQECPPGGLRPLMQRVLQSNRDLGWM